MTRRAVECTAVRESFLATQRGNKTWQQLVTLATDPSRTREDNKKRWEEFVGEECNEGGDRGDDAGLGHEGKGKGTGGDRGNNGKGRGGRSEGQVTGTLENGSSGRTQRGRPGRPRGSQNVLSLSENEILPSLDRNRSEAEHEEESL